MRPSTPEIPVAADKTADAPVVSFSHLSSYFVSDDTMRGNQSMAYGFPAPLEEDLYETGYLAKIFLRC